MPTPCPACGSFIPPDHIDVTADTATCPACGYSTTLSSIAAAHAHSVYSSPPEGCDVQSEPARWRALASTRSARCIPPLIFAALWNGLLSIFIGAVLLGRAPLIVLPFLSLHLAVGAFLLWRGLQGLIGSVEVTIDSATIRVSTGIGPLRITRRRTLREVRGIRRSTDANASRRFGRPAWGQQGLELIANNPLRFGRDFNDERRDFMHAVIAAELLRRQQATHPPTQPGP